MIRALLLSLSHHLWTVKGPLKIDLEPVKNQYKCNNYMKWHSDYLKASYYYYFNNNQKSGLITITSFMINFYFIFWDYGNDK